MEDHRLPCGTTAHCFHQFPTARGTMALPIETRRALAILTLRQVFAVLEVIGGIIKLCILLFLFVLMIVINTGGKLL